MRKFILFVCLLGMMGMLFYCSKPVEVVASKPTYQITKGHAPVWNLAITQIMEMADAMPEEMYSFKPADSSKTFAEQLVHIGGSSKVIANMLMKDIKPDGPPPQMDIAAMNKAEVKAMVKSSLEEAWKIMGEMADNQLLEETCKSFSGNEMSRLEGMWMIHDHLTNHKAKANLYIRMATGNAPPRYKYY